MIVNNDNKCVGAKKDFQRDFRFYPEIQERDEKHQLILLSLEKGKNAPKNLLSASIEGSEKT